MECLATRKVTGEAMAPSNPRQPKMREMIPIVLDQFALGRGSREGSIGGGSDLVMEEVVSPKRTDSPITSQLIAVVTNADLSGWG